MHTLETLLQDLGVVEHPWKQTQIKGLASHSRKVHAGDLYLALQGSRFHGLDFLDEAIERGAVATAWEQVGSLQAMAHPIPLVAIDDLHHKVGMIADRFFGHPSHGMKVIAVTGTNGKTSTAHFISEAFDEIYSACGLIGTLGSGRFNALKKNCNTTPEALALHRQLYELQLQNIPCAVMEASSHGLVQGRLSGVAVDVAVLTNIGRDHYDYHGSEQAYLEAKRLLFKFPSVRHAIINVDCDFGLSLFNDRQPHCHPITYSIQGNPATVSAHHIQVHRDGIRFDLEYQQQIFPIQSMLLGEHNVANLLATFAVLVCQGIESKQAVQHLTKLHAVPGRMQRYGGGAASQPTVILDYAHSADALRSALLACRDITSGQCHCVFGCGGNRDRGKRQLMGAVAEQHADHIVLTDDNPREESPQAIVDDILAGMQPHLEKHKVVHDRAEAISQAIHAAKPEDCVLVAGKGHETEQWVDGVAYPFSDAAVIEQALAGKD